MKAIILAAGLGSRIRPLTNNCPKTLLKIGDHTILEMMISNIQDCGINEIIIILGYLHKNISEHIKNKFPNLSVSFVINDNYSETNTGYSLMLASDFIENSSFIKFDADVVFNKEILKQLIDSKHGNCLCVDHSANLDDEVIKVVVDNKNKVIEISNTAKVLESIGESIGIEKIDSKTAGLLFNELKILMTNKQNHQKYYEAAYDILVKKSVPFYTYDVSGFKWVEIDTKYDLDRANNLFNSK